MVLETHKKLFMTEADFPGKVFLHQELEKRTENGQIYWKIWSLIFTEFVL